MHLFVIINQHNLRGYCQHHCLFFFRKMGQLFYCRLCEQLLRPLSCHGFTLVTFGQWRNHHFFPSFALCPVPERWRWDIQRFTYLMDRHIRYRILFCDLGYRKLPNFVIEHFPSVNISGSSSPTLQNLRLSKCS